MSTIPASQLVQVTPSVVAAGGTGVLGTGLMLTTNTRIPVGTVQRFTSAPAVSAFFGPGNIANDAAVYFGGFEGGTITPANLLMAQYNPTSVAAYLRGGNVSGLTLAQLQAVAGTLTISVDGYSRTNSSVSLSSAGSFSAAASILQTDINMSLPSESSVTASIAEETASFTASISGWWMTVTAVGSGTIAIGGVLSGGTVTAGTTVTGQISGTTGGIGVYAVSVSQVVASASLTEEYGLMTVTAAISGTMAVGQTLTGGTTAANTVVTALGSVTGTYVVSVYQTVSSTTITGSATAISVTYDSVSGAFIFTSGVTGAASTIGFASGGVATSLLLTSATGAVTSQGAAPATPSAFMTSLTTLNSAWMNFMTHFDPDGGGGNAVKQQFAAWKNTAFGGNRFGYFCWDNDATPAASSSATSSLGYILDNNGDSGTALFWEPAGSTYDNGLCAFALGTAASVNYQQTNGRITFAYKAQAGLTAGVSDPTTASNLLANGYNFYGAYGAANQNSVWLQNGSITGAYAWIDSFDTQIWLSVGFLQQLLSLLGTALSVPFTPAGQQIIEGACNVVIQAGLAFGAFAPNTLTASQIQQVNAQAGANIANALQSQGYYLQVVIPPQTTQAARGPWPIMFWYIDRESVQTINLSNVLVQ